LRVLGVSNTWDSGAALIVDGRIVAAANEERFSRIKFDRTFPKKAIEFVLDIGGFDVDEIDLVASGCWNGVDTVNTSPRLRADVAEQVKQSADPDLTARIVKERLDISELRDKEFSAQLMAGLASIGVGKDRVRFFDHHYTHAVSAWSPSGFDDALILTADGRGDGRAVTLWKATCGSLELVDMATELVSPGALYGHVTASLGFTPWRHEGKVTGLAAYGQKSGAYDLLSGNFGFDTTSKRLWSSIGELYSPFVSAELPTLYKQLDQHSREDVSFGVQAVLEESLVGFLRWNIERLGLESTNLCLAGGCVSNVKLNYELRRLDEVDNVYVFPHMGDGGLALGAAMAATMEMTGKPMVPMPTAYLGPEYSDKQIEIILQRSNLEYSKLDEDELPHIVADSLSNNMVIGWFQGRMEVGPRALGARSILASAADSSINDTLNNRLDRTEFMPFAPVTIDKYAARCFLDWDQSDIASQFMTMCYDCTPFLKQKCPAVVHVDNTARPQVVFRDNNPRYYDVIEAYIEMTGNPSIINTSFNHHEEPIVMSPEDAIRSLTNGNVDVLVAGRWMIHSR
jgi:carbamoyltransferase